MLTLKRALGLVALVNLSFFALLIVYNTRTHSSARNKFSNLNANVDMLKAAADLPFSEFSDELDIYISLTDDPNEIPQRYISPKKNTENTENTEQVDTEEKEQIVPYNALRELGAYKSPSLEYFNDFPKAKPRYKTKYMGIKHNKHYCDFVDTINLEHPENVNEKMNFVGDYIPTSLVKRIVFKELGKDVMPQCYMGVSKGSFDMDTTANAFYMKSVVFHHYYEIGSNFKCASQIYGHVPGSGVLTRKDLVVGSVNDYAKRYEDKPQCFNKEMYFPYAYRLYNKTECLQFFEEIDSPKYAKLKEVEPFSFLLKAGYGAHRGQGIKMLDANEEQKVREEYRNGEMCGEIKKSHVAQKYIPNPLLLDLDNKFDFRMYMLIASVDPFIVFYHDGFLRVSLGTYDKDSKERSVHFTNTHLSKAKFAQAKNGKMYNGMNETELRDYQMWKMEDLQDYLLEIGKIDNDRWLDEYLRPKFKEAFIHTVRMAEHAFFKLPGAFEMFGLDFLLDENLNLWFIECNASPQLIGTNDFKTEFLTKMLKDMFEIQYAYLRSRWQRIRVFVEKFNKAMETDKDKVSLPMWQEEFAKINKDRLEPEYKISEDNSWKLIMDKNIKGKGAYLGLLREECIDDEDF